MTLGSNDEQAPVNNAPPSAAYIRRENGLHPPGDHHAPAPAQPHGGARSQGNFYHTVPALAQYINRHGAKEKNFRRWLVQENFGHYYREKCVIKLGPDGTISVSDNAYAPTEAEQAAIRVAFQAGIELPKSMEVQPTAIQDLLPMMRNEHQRAAENADGDPLFFEFYSQSTGMVRMVQQRIDTPTGKRYLPWSFWSDGEWRCMEPDGDLPFWKPKRSTGKTKYMVHEGAKAAKFVSEMCADGSSTHPWIEELRQYEHWGMIGGALSPHRADYDELWDRNPELMVYVCDNDAPGKEALIKVSKNYRRTMWGVQFDQTFPPSWDMADPMPRTLYSDAGRYVGPTIDDLVHHATYATDVIPAPAGSRARPTYAITPYFLKEWVQVREPEVYVNVNKPDKLLSEKAFNGWVRPFSDTDDTARILKRAQFNRGAGLRYTPASPSGLMSDERDNAYVNTYVGPRLVAEAGDVTPWLEYLESTFPIEADRTSVIRWCATLVCHPEIKMKYGLLLISETQGVGKSTLGSDILKPMIGKWNCSEPSEATVTDGNFNGWCAHKRLAIVHEIYAGHNAKAYDKLKSVITERTLRINEKYMAAYDIENWLHVLACSNSKRALKLSMDDRRWLVPAVGEHRRSKAEWKRLHDWLDHEGGHAKIKSWMQEWLSANGGPVTVADTPPHTQAKREVIEEGYSQGQQLVVEVLRDLTERIPNTKLIVMDAALQKRIIDQLYRGNRPDRLESLATVRKVAKGDGWHVVKQRVQAAAWRVPSVGVTTALTNDGTLTSIPIAELMGMVERGEAAFVDVAQVF
ncbi:primase-helicase family protein [Bradyrhizobium japonicum]|uniref:primase-helicase family protein n=1 Tax=Bradyrhizobium japonicum TaxID=375 RepID=UPI0033924696